MKVSATHLTAMRAVIEPLDTAELRASYLAGDFPRSDQVSDLNRRYRWDLFWAARAGRCLPSDLADAHIDTALRRIVPELTGVHA